MREGSPNWAPASAGVVSGRRRGAGRAPMFPREGGGPDWTPAFAGEQAS